MEAEIVTIGKVAAETNEFWHLQAHAAFASAKHVRDGISDWLGINDRSKLLKWEYSQARGIYGEYGVEVHVQTWRQTFEEVLACSTEYQAAHKKSLKAAEARARLEPGTSRARVTTANARWN